MDKSIEKLRAFVNKLPGAKPLKRLAGKNAKKKAPFTAAPSKVAKPKTLATSATVDTLLTKFAEAQAQGKDHVGAFQPMPAAPGENNKNAATNGTQAALSDAEAYGNKTANLAQIHQILAKADLGGNVAVPLFRGISHQTVRAHLLEEAGPALRLLERRLKNAAPKGTKALSPEARQVLQEMRALIKQTLIKSPPLLPLFAKDAWLMVRSTGREDSETMANAGGNKSIANVPNNKTAIAEAIAEVVGSYFSDRSILQRLLEGDDISSPPFTPVLLQVMIGEKPGGDIPSSGVMFTVEPEGPTPVTQIQATFGHNEAVVASLLPCDTYLVGPAGVRVQKKHKPQRLVPNTTGHGPALIPAENPPAKRTASALPESVVKRLDALGKLLSAHQGGIPLDIEFTYTPANDTVYLLQMRPLVLGERDKPTYLDPVKFRDADKLQGTMIGAAGGKTRLLASPDAVLMASNLTQALKIYLASQTADEIEAVVVEGHAEPTSHEATMFRAARKPVMVVDDLTKVQAFLKAHSSTALDASMGELVDVSKALDGRAPATLDQLKEAGLLHEGWGKHPLPAAHTPGHASMDPQSISELIAGVLADIKGAASAAATPALNGAAVVELLDALQTHTADLFVKGGPRKRVIERLLNDLRSAPDAKSRALAMAGLLHVSYNMAAYFNGDGLLAQRARDLFHGVCAQLGALRAAATADPGGIMHLYELNGLTSLMLHHSDPTIVGNDSFVSLLAARKERATLSNGFARDYRQVYQRVGKMATRETVASAWSQFVQALAEKESIADNNRLAQLLYDVQALGVAEMWLHTSFVEAAAGERPSPKSILDKLHGDFAAKANAQALSRARDLRRSVEIWRGRIADWGDPNEFAELYAEFTSSFVDKLKTSEAYEDAGRLGKLALLASMSDAVDVFDQSIKGLTGSTSYESNSTKAENFRKLLLPYSALAGAWLEAAPKLAQQRSGYETAGHWVRSHHAALEKRSLSDPDREFRPSPSFNVSAAQIGSGSQSTQHSPQALEDYFTLAHQNLLVILAAMTANTMEGAEILPPAAQRVTDVLVDKSISTADYSPTKATLVGVSYRYPLVNVAMNMTLREHSLKLDIEQDLTAPDHVNVKINMFGLIEHNRQERAMLYAMLFGAAVGVPFKEGAEPRFDRSLKTTSWVWQVPTSGYNTDQFVGKLIKFLEIVAKTTFSHETLDKMVSNLRSLTSHVDANVGAMPDPALARIPLFLYDLVQTYPDEFKFYALAFKANASDLRSDSSNRGYEDLQADLVKKFIATAARSKSPITKSIISLPQTDRTALAERVWGLNAADDLEKIKLFALFHAPYSEPALNLVSTPMMRVLLDRLVSAPLQANGANVNAKVIERRLEEKWSGFHGLASLPNGTMRFEILKKRDNADVITLKFHNKVRRDAQGNWGRLLYAGSVYAKLFAHSHGLRFATDSEPQYNKVTKEATWAWEIPSIRAKVEEIGNRLRSFVELTLEHNYSLSTADAIVRRLKTVIPSLEDEVKKTPSIFTAAPWLKKPMLERIPEYLPLYTQIANGNNYYSSSALPSMDDATWTAVKNAAAKQLYERLSVSNSPLRAQALSLTYEQRNTLRELIRLYHPDKSNSRSIVETSTELLKLVDSNIAYA